MIATVERTVPAHAADARRISGAVEAEDLKKAVALLRSLPAAKGSRIVAGREHVIETVIVGVSPDGRRLVFAGWDKDGNDCEAYLSVRLPIWSKPERWVVSKAALFGVVNNISVAATPTVSLAGDSFTVTVGDCLYPIAAKPINPDDYPDVPLMPVNQAQVSAADLRRMISRTLPFTAAGEGRAINGIHIAVQSGKITLVSTDESRLALDARPAGFNPINGCTVPVPLAKLIAAALRRCADEPVRLASDGKRFWARGWSFRVSGRLIDGQFPRYNDVMPDPKHCKVRVEVSAIALFAAVKSAASLAEDRAGGGPGVHIQWGASGLTVAPDERRDVTFAVPGAFSGEPGGMTYKAGQMLEMLSVVPVDAVVLHISDSDGPLRLDAGDYCHLLMPDNRRR